MRKILCNRVRYLLPAIALLLLEFTVLIWPVGWLRDDKEFFLAGYDSKMMELVGANDSLCQEFVPRYANVKSIGIYFSGQEIPAEGRVHIILSDAEDQVLFQQTLSCAEIEYDTYTDLDINLRLKTGKHYYLNISRDSLKEGQALVVGLSGSGETLKENQRLYYEEELEGSQLLTRYRYKDALSADKVLPALFWAVASAVVIYLGLPENRKFRQYLGILVWLLVPWILGGQLERGGDHLEMRLPFAMQYNIVIMYLLELIVLGLVGSVRYSVILTNTFLTIVYTTNYFVLHARGTSLRLNDLFAAKTAIRVAERYDLQPSTQTVMAWLMLIFFAVLVIQTGERKNRSESRFRLRILARTCSFLLGIVLAVGMGYILLRTDYLEQRGFTNIRGWATEVNYREDGFLVATCLNIQDAWVTKPIDYAKEKAEKILEGYKEMTSEAGVSQDLPHVILIMNESFSDLRVLGNLELSEENLPFYNSLEENTVRGWVNASVMGGGTSNSEFELFTGCSMGLLPVPYYAYEQCMKKPVESLVSMSEKAGYTTYSMHPESRGNYNRQMVYQFLGFDHSFWEEDFEGAQVIHNGVSDAETYRKIEQLFEARTEGEKMFIFDLTMQNHGGYEALDVGHEIHAANVSDMEADVFLSLMKESDLAFEELIHYFEGQQEKVIVCMFGDHQPSLSNDFYNAIYEQTEGLTESDILMNQYRTPFVIWANYDIPEQEGIDISMNYLGILLAQTIGLPQTPYYCFLQEQMKEYPIVTVNGYVNNDGQYFSWEEGVDPFSEYRILQYYYLFN